MAQKYVCRLVCRYIFLGQKYTAHADSEMKQSEIELCMAKATEMQKKYTAHADSEMKQSKIELCMA